MMQEAEAKGRLRGQQQELAGSDSLYLKQHKQPMTMLEQAQ
jgi:hypothetical protein